VSRSRPSIYLDTALLSALYYRGGSLDGIRRQRATEEWWEQERRHFRLFASGATEDELREGDYGAKKAAIAAVLRLPYVPVTREAEQWAEWYVEQGIIPLPKRTDALQLALASVHEIDYLLTWNYAHLANAATQARLSEAFPGAWAVDPVAGIAGHDSEGEFGAADTAEVGHAGLCRRAG